MRKIFLCFLLDEDVIRNCCLIDGATFLWEFSMVDDIVALYFGGDV